MKYNVDIFVANDDIRTVEVDAADPAAAHAAGEAIIKQHFHSGASVITVQPADAEAADAAAADDNEENHFNTGVEQIFSEGDEQ